MVFLFKNCHISYKIDNSFLSDKILFFLQYILAVRDNILLYTWYLKFTVKNKVSYYAHFLYKAKVVSLGTDLYFQLYVFSQTNTALYLQLNSFIWPSKFMQIHLESNTLSMTSTQKWAKSVNFWAVQYLSHLFYLCVSL